MTTEPWNLATMTAGAGQANDQAKARRAAAQARLLADLKSDDPEVRTKAWQNAGNVGATVLTPLAQLVAEGDLEVSRAAKRAMWKLVRTAGDPSGRKGLKPRVVKQLTKLLDDDQPNAVRRDVLWMLSEIAGDESVPVIAELLSQQPLREDARLVLDRIPGEKSLQALRDALATVPDDFKIHIAQSLRHRGVDVPGLPCQKLVPTRATSVKPL